jgi:hypothetical protein
MCGQQIKDLTRKQATMRLLLLPAAVFLTPAGGTNWKWEPPTPLLLLLLPASAAPR